MRFEIAFHGPFRVGTGEAGPGVDETVHRQGLLPASSLKGVMRATARSLLGSLAGGREHPVVAEVFGTARHPSPWSWTGATFATQHVRRRARVQRDPDTGTVVEHALTVAEEVWAPDASFEVLLRGHLDGTTQRRHEIVLAASAHGTHALGAERRRGLGWVTVRRADAPFGENEVGELVAIRSVAGGG